MAAVKREKPEPLLDDVALCAQTGWTLHELRAQPARFIEKLSIYLNAVADRSRAEERRLEDELRTAGMRRP